MINTDQTIKISSDTGKGVDYEVYEILYESKDLIVANVSDADKKENFSVLIYRRSGEVVARELRFYYASNP